MNTPAFRFPLPGQHRPRAVGVASGVRVETVELIGAESPVRMAAPGAGGPLSPRAPGAFSSPDGTDLDPHAPLGALHCFDSAGGRVM